MPVAHLASPSNSVPPSNLPGSRRASLRWTLLATLLLASLTTLIAYVLLVPGWFITLDPNLLTMLGGAPVPELVIRPGLSIDLGTGGPNETLKAEFQVCNNGAAPLTFQIVPSCGCTELTPRSGVVQSGDSIAIRAAVRLGDRGSNRQVTLAFATNDPRARTLHCHLRAACPELLKVSSRSLAFGRIAHRTAAAQTIRIRSVGTASPLQASQLKSRVHHPYVRVTGPTWKDSHEAEFSIHISDTAPPGLIATAIEFSAMIHGAEELCRVPVSADVGGRLLASPRTIIVPAGMVGGLQRDVLVWAADGESLPDRWSATMPPGYSMVERDSATSRRRIRLAVSGTPEISEPVQSIEICFPEWDESVSIALKFAGSKSIE